MSAWKEVKKYKNWAEAPNAFMRPVGCFFLAIWAAAFAAYVLGPLITLQEGIIANAVVTDSGTKSRMYESRRSSFHYVNYVFQLPDGTSVEGYEEYSGTRKKGETIQVRYIPSDPKISRIVKDETQSWMVGLGCIVLALILALTGVRAAITMKKYRRT